GAINDDAQKLVDEYDVRTASIGSPVRTLSGGNKQKVIAAREFSQNAKFLVAAQPTRGIDVGSIEFVHQQLVDQRDDGIAVLLVSAELDEIMSLSDRIGVIYQGRLVAVGKAEDFTRNQIGQLMASGSTDA
ncbi:MAG: heme ABC transporter ATP-binding protein, partial [Acidimicrobiales bacterium]